MPKAYEIVTIHGRGLPADVPATGYPTELAANQRGLALHEGAFLVRAEGDQSDNERELRRIGDGHRVPRLLRLEKLSAHSFGLWSSTLSTARSDGDARYKLAADAGMEATDAWRRALAYYTACRFGDMKAALDRAAELAKEWGDDTDERAALALYVDAYIAECTNRRLIEIVQCIDDPAAERAAAKVEIKLRMAEGKWGKWLDVFIGEAELE